MVVFFSQMFSGSHGSEQTSAGWFGFAVVIGLVSFLGALATILGTKEEKSAIRENTEKVRLRDVFSVIGKNDQLMWLSLSYFLFAFSYVITNSLLLYYFRYVMGRAAAFSTVGVITAS